MVVLTRALLGCHVFPSTGRGIAGAHPLPERELRCLTRGERKELLSDVEGIEEGMRGGKEEKGVFTGTRVALGKVEAEERRGEEEKGEGEGCPGDGEEVREGWFEDEDEDEDVEDVMHDDFVLVAPRYSSRTARGPVANADTSTSTPAHPPSSLAFDKTKPVRPANPSLLSRLLSSINVPNAAAAPLEPVRPPTPPLEGDAQAFLRASAYFAKHDAARVPLLAVGWKFGGGEAGGEGAGDRVGDTPAVDGEDTCTIDSVEREFSDLEDEARGDEEGNLGEDEYERCRRIVFGRASGASEADDGTEVSSEEPGYGVRNAQVSHEDTRVSISISSEGEDSVSDDDLLCRLNAPSPDNEVHTCFGVDPAAWPVDPTAWPVDLTNQLSNAENTSYFSAFSPTTTAPPHDLDPTHAIPPAQHPSDQNPSRSPPPSKLTLSLLALALLALLSTATYLTLSTPRSVRQNPNSVPATCAPACPNAPPSTVFARSSAATYTASPYVPVERVFGLAARARETGVCAVVVDGGGVEGEDGARGVLERVGDVVGVVAWAGRWRWAGWGGM